MVLQRGEPIHIWGKAIPGKKVMVSFASKTKNAIVEKDSSWSVYLTKQKANSKPQSISISCGDNRIALQNVLVGDICSAI